MKNYKNFVWSLALAALFSACSSDDDVKTEEVIEVSYPMELTVTFPEMNDGFQHTGWDNATLMALRTDTRGVDKSELKKEASDVFVGTTVDQLDEYSDLALFYPASASTVATSDTMTQALCVALQQGTLADLANHDYAWGKYDGAEPTSAVSMTPVMSLAKFQFQLADGASLSSISQIIITATSGELYSNGVFDMTSGKFITLEAGSVVVKNDAGLSDEVYAAFFPEEEGVSLHFTLTTKDGKAYEGECSQTVVFEAGASYEFAPVVCASLPAARVGDYFYSDATWSSVWNPAKKCVGIVFALDDAQGNLNTSAEASVHGRVVALKDCVEKVTWSLTSGDVEAIANYSVLQDTMTIGSLPYFEGESDSFFSDVKAEQLNQVEVDPVSGRVLKWYTQGALSHWDGEEASSHIHHNISQYPAATWCFNDRYGFYGWYLPSAGELALLWALQNLDVIGEESHEGFVDLEKFGYWSSTECNEGYAWYINFYSGIVYSSSKKSGYNCRPMLRF